MGGLQGDFFIYDHCVFSEEWVFMKEKEYKPVTISVPISAETNRLLTESAKRARRSKKIEAVLRLSDHLRIVDNIEGHYQQLLTKY